MQFNLWILHFIIFNLYITQFSVYYIFCLQIFILCECRDYRIGFQKLITRLTGTRDLVSYLRKRRLNRTYNSNMEGIRYLRIEFHQ